MALASKTFRLFVSSTFSDLKEERNALQKKVFPELRTLCLQYGFRFQAIDLRWGVSQEASQNQETMRICLKEIERCQNITPRPNFIVLLGDRYGWEPVPEEIPAEEFTQIKQVIEKNKQEFPDNAAALLDTWYRKDTNAVPPVYILQPAGSDNNDSQETVLSILRKTVEKLDLSPDRKLKYLASATHQEVENGALRVEDADQHVFGFFRSITNLDEVKKALPDKSAKDFLDTDKNGTFDASAHDKLTATKKSLEDKLGTGNIFPYEVQWKNNTITTDHLDTLCKDVLHSLSAVIRKEAEKAEHIDELDKEVDAHTAFGVDRARFFIGRVRILDDIKKYIKTRSTHPLVVYGESGSGKSALMAQAAEQVQNDNPQAVYITRFIGATPPSSDIRSLLESICRQISRIYGADEENIPTDYNELTKELPKRLALATAEKPLIIFLDALDQLSKTHNAKTLNWLPADIPEQVNLILSAVSVLPDGSQESCYQALRQKLPQESLLEITPMPADEGEELLNIWLEKDAHRTLQPQQRQHLLDNFKQNGKPLYLKFAYEEAQRWKSYTPETETTLSPDIPGIIQDLFTRLSSEKNHGAMLVSRSLGYIAAGKNGLSEDELIDVLSEDKEFFQDFLNRAFHKPPENRLPVIVWSRLYFDLEPYLIEISADGTTLMTFYHPTTFGNQVKEKYLSEKHKTQRHKQLAEYFEKQDLYSFQKKQKTPNLRKLSELPFQQSKGEMWDEVYETLTDFEFLEAKCTHSSVTSTRMGKKTKKIYGGVYELLEDYRRSLENYPTSNESK